MDTQTIELLGRNRLIDELLLAGLEVAIPERDRGVDLIAYMDLTEQTSTFAAVPIQLKAASTRAFSLNAKYERISNLVLAYVWGLKAPDHAQTFALTYQEALNIAEQLGWTKTASWAQGKYTTSVPSKRICQLLEPFAMSAPAWRKKVSEVSGVRFS